MGNVREEGINMYLTDNYTPKMNQIISVTDNFRRATVAVSLSTNVMASSIKNSIGSASNRVNSLNSSLRKVQTTASSVSSTMTKLSSSINAVSGVIGSLNGSIMRLAITIAMIIDYFNKLIQKKNEFNSNIMIILIFKAKSDEVEKTKNKLLGNLKKIGGKIWNIVIKAKDMTKRVISSILGKLKQVEKRPYQGSINLKDMVSSAMGRILPKLMLFKNTFWSGVIAIKDMASGIISKVFPKLRLFAGKVWSGAIAVKDMASGILGSIKGKISDLTNGATIGVAVKKGVDLLGQEQNQKVVLESVMKRNTGKVNQIDVDDYYGSLVRMANDTPFDPEDVVAMGTKAKMISNITGGKKEKDITQAMVDVRALNMNTSSEQDVSAAFLSAAKGNMESLNTLVGENYKTFDEALEGISVKQMGLAKEMSNTIPGIISGAQTSITMA
ncbi:putative phage domain protein [Clostridioides difficile Y184]|nr:putative phage domain protein [Clostridioides difficile Y184]